jgi:hypothetical protein
MNALPGRWRRFAVRLAQHAAWVLPGGRAPWAEAMRRELDYIADDPAALRWALGCVLASYRARLTDRPTLRARMTWQRVAAGGALMVLIGVALQENAGGQTAPPRPAFDETTCEGLLTAPAPRERKIVTDAVDRPALAPQTPCADRSAPAPQETRDR